MRREKLVDLDPRQGPNTQTVPEQPRLPWQQGCLCVLKPFGSTCCMCCSPSHRRASQSSNQLRGNSELIHAQTFTSLAGTGVFTPRPPLMTEHTRKVQPPADVGNEHRKVYLTLGSFMRPLNLAKETELNISRKQRTSLLATLAFRSRQVDTLLGPRFAQGVAHLSLLIRNLESSLSLIYTADRFSARTDFKMILSNHEDQSLAR